MAPTVKKGTPKASTKNNGIAAKPHVSAHPSWIDMIKVSQRSPPARQTSLSCLALAHLLYLGMYHCQFCRQSRRCLTSYDQKGPCPLSSSPLFREVEVAPSLSSRSIISKSIMLLRASSIELSMPVSCTRSSRFRKVGYPIRESSILVFIDPCRTFRQSQICTESPHRHCQRGQIHMFLGCFASSEQSARILNPV